MSDNEHNAGAMSKRETEKKKVQRDKIVETFDKLIDRVNQLIEKNDRPAKLTNAFEELEVCFSNLSEVNAELLMSSSAAEQTLASTAITRHRQAIDGLREKAKIFHENKNERDTDGNHPRNSDVSYVSNQKSVTKVDDHLGEQAHCESAFPGVSSSFIGGSAVVNRKEKHETQTNHQKKSDDLLVSSQTEGSFRKISVVNYSSKHSKVSCASSTRVRLLRLQLEEKEMRRQAEEELNQLRRRQELEQAELKEQKEREIQRMAAELQIIEEEIASKSGSHRSMLSASSKNVKKDKVEEWLDKSEQDGHNSDKDDEKQSTSQHSLIGPDVGDHASSRHQTFIPHSNAPITQNVHKSNLPAQFSISRTTYQQTQPTHTFAQPIQTIYTTSNQGQIPVSNLFHAQPPITSTLPVPNSVHQPQTSTFGHPQVQPHTVATKPAHSFERSLPKWQLDSFSGDPLAWPEWKQMFECTIGNSFISDIEKLNHLRSLLTGKAKLAIGGISVTSGSSFLQAWSTLERKFGKPHVIIAAQLDRLRRHTPVKMHSSEHIIDYSLLVTNLVQTLNELGYHGDLQSTSNLQLALSKLPPNLKTEWSTFVVYQTRSGATLNLVDFEQWLGAIAECHEHLLSNGSTKPPDSQTSQQRNQKKTLFAATMSKESETSFQPCCVCNGRHNIWKCEKFKKMTVDERAELVKTKQLCFNCLNTGHTSRQCTRTKKCGTSGCEKTHHYLLHGAKRVYPKKTSNENGNPAETRQTTSEKPVEKVLTTTLNENSRGLLQVVSINVTGSSSQSSFQVLALCDSGSTHSWVDEDLAVELNLAGERHEILLSSFSETISATTTKVKLKISPYNDPADTHEVKALTRKNLSVGNERLNLEKLKQTYPQLQTIPYSSIDLGNVKILLGQDVFSLMRPLEYRSRRSNEPWAVRLPLGWVLSGPLPATARKMTTMFVESCDDSLTAQVKSWWDIESYASRFNVDSRSLADSKAVEILEKTTSFNGKRYSIGLLWENDDSLPNNYGSAVAQLKTLEKRLDKDNDLKTKYTKTITDDEQNGYIRKVMKAEQYDTIGLKQWYLPHHPVRHPTKPQKVRRVCNAAAKYKGISLNDNLLTGPDLLNSLIGIILRFREGPIAVTADIEAMFMQVEVKDDDQRALRFLWRDDPTSEISVYQYTRHVFGAKDSPACANYALHRTAIDNANTYPEASASLKKDFYMDDFLKSFQDADKAMEIASSMKSLLALGGFKLTKWNSNLKIIRDQLSPEATSDEVFILGVKWKLIDDSLEVFHGIDERTLLTETTQRTILSHVSSVFDPLGLLAPVTVTARLLLKRIWQKRGQKWDEVVCKEDEDEYRSWSSQLAELQQQSISRYLFKDTDLPIERQLHVFGDASLSAMCAVAYIRAIFPDGIIESSFIIGKVRVAPMRSMTVPKLELQAAVIAARLSLLINQETTLNFSRTVFWSDSSTVLQWLRHSDKKQPIFVANRVTEILDTSTIDQWCYVPTEFNTADLGTRGLSATELRESRWLTGPAFLLEDESDWPKDFANNSSNDILDNNGLCALARASPLIIDWNRFSKFERLQRMLAWIFRLLHRYRGYDISSSPGSEELESGKLAIFKLVQMEVFSDERRALLAGKDCPSGSQLSPLLPFLDSNEILRAKGRLRKSNVDFNAKHPILLSSKHRAIELFLDYEHRNNHHEGCEHLRSIIQQKHWIIGLRSALRSIKHKCVMCRRRSANSDVPQMADLPSERFQSTFPFAATGIDYFGPFEIKLFRRTLKRWVCLFTCLSTRAVHLEVCQSLDTDSCIMAIRRFIARRGKPKTIVSDNGTNFVGAEREFRECQTQWNKEHMQTTFAQDGITWKFNPPGAPHFGGVWERLVRCCKKSMFAILGSRRLTDEVLSTVLCLVEQTLNARPLTAVSSDISDLEALTPNHFLIGRPNINLPSCLTNSSDIDHKKLFRQCEAYADSIWTRWIKEYLPTLQPRAKWRTDSVHQISSGDLVWLADPAFKRSHYPLGRVLETYPGDDGIIRTVKIRTIAGTYVRPVAKLVPVHTL